MHTVSFPKLGLEFNINPNALQIGNFRITWYGIIIAVGILLAMLMAFRNAKRFGVNADKLVDVVLGGLIGGVVGARLYFVIFSWDQYKDNLSSIWHTWEGGMAIYGGVIGAFLVGMIVARCHKMRVLPVLDLASLGFLIGQGVGRWGNFVNGEAFGCNTSLPWGMTGDRIVAYLSDTSNVATLTSLGVTVDPNAPVHPCFLYESMWCLLGFVLLYLYARKHRRFDGEIFLMYLGWYGFERMIVEGLRTDSLLIGKIRVSQLLAGLLFVACLITWLVVRSKIRSAHDDNYLRCYVLTEQYQKDEADYAAYLALRADKAKWKEEKARIRAEKKAKKDAAKAEKEAAKSKSTDQTEEDSTPEVASEKSEETVETVSASEEPAGTDTQPENVQGDTKQ